MHIKSLEMTGFKSYRGKKTIEFSPGINGEQPRSAVARALAPRSQPAPTSRALLLPAPQ